MVCTACWRDRPDAEFKSPGDRLIVHCKACRVRKAQLEERTALIAAGQRQAAKRLRVDPKPVEPSNPRHKETYYSKPGALLKARKLKKAKRKSVPSLTGRAAECYGQRDEIIKALFKETYPQYLRSPKWKRIREKVMLAADGRCALCPNLASQVHHHYYSADNLSGRSLHGLYAVCEDCHENLEFDQGKKLNHQQVQQKLSSVLSAMGKRIEPPQKRTQQINAGGTKRLWFGCLRCGHDAIVLGIEGQYRTKTPCDNCGGRLRLRETSASSS